MNGLSFTERMLVFYGAVLPNHPRKWLVHASLRRLFNVNIDKELQVVRNGLNWSLNPSDFEHENLFWLGGMDRWDIFHLQSLLSSGSVFYDIGANFGYYSLMLAHSLNGDCSIRSFEPNPKTYQRLRTNIQLNHLQEVVKTFPIALSDSNGTGTLIERADNSGASRLGNDSTGISVDVRTLDSFCNEKSEERLDAVKIDVEGYEVRVLHGAHQTISKFKPAIVIEFWTPGLKRAEATVDDIADVLGEMGYELFIPMRGNLQPLRELPRGDDPVNVFAFHKDRPASSFAG